MIDNETSDLLLQPLESADITINLVGLHVHVGLFKCRSSRKTPIIFVSLYISKLVKYKLFTLIKVVILKEFSIFEKN